MLIEEKMASLKKLKEDTVEILIIVKACLTSIWFWVPVIYAIYFYMQIWLIFCVHPLTLLILPSILLTYLIIREEKNANRYYKLYKVKYLSASHPLGSGPEVKSFKWDVEKVIKEYENILKKKVKRKKSN